MQLQQAIQNVFLEITRVLNNLSDEQYIQPAGNLSGATIGQHVRHIIELFICLEDGYSCGLVNYEKRKRDYTIESNKSVAVKLLEGIYTSLHKKDKPLLLEAGYNDGAEGCITVQSNYLREVVYNLEHTVHHMALIRVGVKEVSEIQLPEGFGVASSTIKYRQQCAQ